MEAAREITVKLVFTRTHVLFALVFFFIAWHPGFIGSETLQLTTYYPAPYGGYVNLLTTGQTLLARDGGRVGVNTGTTLPPRAALDVRGEVVSMGRFTMSRDGQTTSPTWSIDNNLNGIAPSVGDRFRIFRQPSIGTPGVEFLSVNNVGNVGIAYGPLNALDRLHISNGNLRIEGNGSTTGFMRGICVSQPYAAGTVSCPWNYPRVMASYSTANCPNNGLLFLGGNFQDANRWVPHVISGCSGIMLCCRVRDF